MDFNYQEMEKEVLTDFWEWWDKLASLEVEEEKDKDDMEVVKWSRCNQISLLARYSGKMYGIDIDRYKRKWIKTKMSINEYIEEFGIFYINEDIKENLEWQLWSNYIDLETNLQCILWERTFCFDCILEWMNTNSSWPNWGQELKKSDLKPNNELIRYS